MGGVEDDGFGLRVVQFEVFEGDAGYVVFLESGEQGEAGGEGLRESCCLGPGEVAVLGWEGDAVVDLGELRGAVGFVGHFGCFRSVPSCCCSFSSVGGNCWRFRKFSLLLFILSTMTFAF